MPESSLDSGVMPHSRPATHSFSPPIRTLHRVACRLLWAEGEDEERGSQGSEAQTTREPRWDERGGPRAFSSRGGPQTAERLIANRNRQRRVRMLSHRTRAWIGPLAALTLASASQAQADVVTTANATAAEITSRHPATPISVRMMAIVQVSVFDAVSAVTGRYAPLRATITAAPGASVDAAVAAATRTALLKL